jgi:hypothetical protein
VGAGLDAVGGAQPAPRQAGRPGLVQRRAAAAGREPRAGPRRGRRAHTRAPPRQRSPRATRSSRAPTPRPTAAPSTAWSGLPRPRTGRRACSARC